jgi:hypothetical protein
MKVRRQEGCCKTRWREVPSREPRKRDRERERERGGEEEERERQALAKRGRRK